MVSPEARSRWVIVYGKHPPDLLDDRDENYQMFEYACHEGNTAVEMTLGGGRARDRQKSK